MWSRRNVGSSISSSRRWTNTTTTTASRTNSSSIGARYNTYQQRKPRRRRNMQLIPESTDSNSNAHQQKWCPDCCRGVGCGVCSSGLCSSSREGIIIDDEYRRGGSHALTRLVILLIAALNLVGLSAVVVVSNNIQTENSRFRRKLNAVNEPTVAEEEIFHHQHENVNSGERSLSLDRGISSSAQILRPKKPAECHSTIVMSYYEVWGSQETSVKFETWAESALSYQDCMVLFVQPELMPTVQRLRADKVAKTVIIGLEMGDLPAARIHMEDPDFWDNQVDVDLQYGLNRSYQHFWIALSKTWFVAQAVEHDWFGSDFFLYSDMERIVDSSLAGQELIQHPESVPKDRIVWMTQRRPIVTNTLPKDIGADIVRHPTRFFHRGWQGAGNGDAWLDYHERFALMIDAFLEHNWGIGEEQIIQQSVCHTYRDQCAYFTQILPNSLHRMLYHGNDKSLWYIPDPKKEAASDQESG